MIAPDLVLTAGHCAAPGLEQRVHYRDEAGQPVEYGDHCYRYDQYAFDVTVYER